MGQRTRNFADPVDVSRVRSAWVDARVGAAWTKKSSITSGTSRRSRASTDLPTIADRFSSFLARPSSVDSVIARNRAGFTSRTIRASMSGHVGLAGVEIAEEPLQEVAGEDLADHVEDLIGAEFLADLPEPFQQLREDAPLVGVLPPRS